MQKHLMLDVETLGTDPRSVILSLGAVLFTEEKIEAGFYCTLDVNEQLKVYKRQVSAETLSWWLDQGAAARSVIDAPEKIALGDGLQRLIEWLETTTDTNSLLVWANGASFDLPLLATAFSDTNLKAPWRFWNERCFRTLKAMARSVPAPERAGTHHNAVDDAIFQATHLINIWNAKAGVAPALATVDA